MLHNNLITLCITDSDKFSPKSPDSPTSKKCIQIKENSDCKFNSIHDHIILPCREIENFIPSGIVYDYITEENNKLLSYFEEIILASAKINETAYEYIDLKSGTSLKKTYFLDNTYWKNIQQLNISPNHCLESMQCTKKSCTCMIIPGISEKITENIISWASKKSSSELYRCAAKSFNNKNWVTIGRHLYEWTVSFGRVSPT